MIAQHQPMTPIRVAHLTSVHPADDPRIAKECAALRDAGYAVTLVAAPARRPDATPAPDVVTLPPVRTRLQRLVVRGWRVLTIAASRRFDVCHIHDPELIWAGVVLKVLGRRVIYDVHEHLPRQVMGKRWIPSTLRPAAAILAQMLERLADIAFDAIVIANPTSLERFRNARRALVQNFAEVSTGGTAGLVPYAARPFNVVYVGAISPDRGLWTMVDAINEVENVEARLILVGEVGLEVRAEIRKRDASDRVRLTGWLSGDEIRELLARSRVGLAVLRPLPNYLANYPTKLFEYMEAGIPAIVSNFSLWREVIDESGSGLTITPDDSTELAEAIVDLFNDETRAGQMGLAGRRAVTVKYSWESQSESLRALYSSVCRARN